MRTADQLAGFVGQALKEGHSRERIRVALLEAGWTASEAEAALSAWAESDFSLPIPKPRPYVTAAEAFFYALMYITLAVAAGHLVSLTFALAKGADALQDGEVFRAWSGELGIIRWSFAALVITFPLFLAMNIWSQRRIGSDPSRRRSLVQKWLGYLALIISILALVADAVTVLFILITGEATRLFFYDALIVAVVAGAVLFFFLNENRDVGRPEQRALPGGLTVPQALWSVLVLAALVGGWLASDGIVGARIEERDSYRETDLRNLAEFVDCVADKSGGVLPAELSGHPDCDVRERTGEISEESLFNDLYTGEPYRYERVSTNEFRVCARLERPEAAGYYFDKYDAPWACGQHYYTPPRTN